MSLPTLKVNTLIVTTKTLAESLAFASVNSLKQFSVVVDDDFVTLSTPVTSSLEANIPGMLHGARARASAEEKPKPPTGGGNPDGTPPNGGTPGTPTLSLPDTWVLPSAVAA